MCKEVVNSDKITQRHCPKGVHGKINSMIIFVIRYTGVLLKYSCKPIFGQIAKKQQSMQWLLRVFEGNNIATVTNSEIVYRVMAELRCCDAN